MSKSRPADDHIFLIIGDKAFTLADLGEAADMRIDRAMQSIIDQGLLGPEHIGSKWFDIIKSSGLKMECLPTPDETLLFELHARYQAQMIVCKELNAQGTLTQADKDEMMVLRGKWQAAKKLSTP